MKKHHKITTPERDQIAWWLGCGVAIREMVKRLALSPCKVPNTSYRNCSDWLLNLGVYLSQKGPFLRQSPVDEQKGICYKRETLWKKMIHSGRTTHHYLRGRSISKHEVTRERAQEYLQSYSSDLPHEPVMPNIHAL